MDHHLNAGAYGEVEGFDDKYYFGRRPTGFYIPRFRNWGSDKRDYLRGFGYQGAASRQGWQRNVAEMGIGADLKNALAEPGPWTIGMSGFGETLPDHSNKISLDHSVKDKWGLPVLAMDAELKANEIKMRKDMMQDGIDILVAGGAKNVQGFNEECHPGKGIHEMGTARMGRDAKTSVLNSFNQVWDAPNVFITDGACMTSASCVNPSLTYMALTARAAAYAVDALKTGEL
jgi:choline dehydrogenase-like flavoprotein